MKRIFLLLLFFTIFFSPRVEAQLWSKGIGMRLGSPLAISYKQFISKKIALEGIFGASDFSNYAPTTTLAIAVHFHNNIIEDNFGVLRWYYGVGGAVNASKGEQSLRDSPLFFYGIQGYIGVDYNFDDVPFSISLDWIPTFRVPVSVGGFTGKYGAVAVRYIF